jgi:hypothetical protein
MTRDRDFERATTDWLDAGSDSTPPHVIDAVLLAVRTTPQERDLRIPWRIPSMKSPLFAAATVAVILAAVFIAIYGPGLGGTNNAPAAGSTVAPSPTATTRPTPRPTPAPPPIDTMGWNTYESERYGFSIGYPPDWTTIPAEHAWTWARDGGNWLSKGMEAFMAPAYAVRVSVWPIPLEPREMIDSVEDLQAWVANYCDRMDQSAACTDLDSWSTPMCLEVRDCHPALMVEFGSDVQGFFSGGTYGADTMMVVSVWWPDDAPATRPYGGSKHLLKAFLETMGVCPSTDSQGPRSPACQP